MSYKNKLNFKAAKKHMNDNLQKTASTLGVFLEVESKARTPVDTGHLRRSITHDTDIKKDKATVFVGSNVEYDSIVELGLGGQKAQPHHVPSITENVSAINSIVKKGLSVK